MRLIERLRCRRCLNVQVFEQLTGTGADAVGGKHIDKLQFNVAALSAEHFVFAVQHIEQGAVAKAELLLIGATHLHAAIGILFGDRHLLPGIFQGVPGQTQIFVQLTLGMAGAVLLESALSFLGLGAPPPAPSWGGMLSTGKTYLLQAPWYALVPGLALTLLVLALYLLSDSLRQVLDPKRGGLHG